MGGVFKEKGLSKLKFQGHLCSKSVRCLEILLVEGDYLFEQKYSSLHIALFLTFLWSPFKIGTTLFNELEVICKSMGAVACAVLMCQSLEMKQFSHCCSTRRNWDTARH